MTATPSPRSFLERVRSSWPLFRSRSVYFQLKVLVVAVYVAAVLLTLAFVLAPRRVGRNELGARVTVLPGDPLMGRYFVIENRSKRDWVGVRFEIDGGYQTRRDVVLAGQKVTLYLSAFTRDEAATQKKRARAAAAPPSQPVTRLRIETRGRVTIFPLGSPP